VGVVTLCSPHIKPDSCVACRNRSLLDHDDAEFSTDYKQLHENLIRDEAEEEEEEEKEATAEKKNP
jgi:hypothetical protein